jgi:CysZ protein
MIQRFFNGFDFILRGRRFLKSEPSLRKWVIVPLIIDVAVFAAAIYFGFAEIKALVYQLSIWVLGSAQSGFFEILYYPLLVLFWLIAFVLCFYFVYVLASIIAAPFNSMLAERALVVQKSIVDEPKSVVQILKTSLKMLLVSLKRAVLFLGVGLILFILSLIPGLNLLAAFGVFVLLAFDSMDYSFEAAGWDLQQRINFLRNNFAEFCGMGAFVALTAFVPGLTLLLMPLAVLGSAHLFSELKGKQ